MFDHSFPACVFLFVCLVFFFFFEWKLARANQFHSVPGSVHSGSKVYAYLGVTCHLHFWQNDRGLVRATAVTRG